MPGKNRGDWEKVFHICKCYGNICRVGFLTNTEFVSALHPLANWQVFILDCTNIGTAHTDDLETHSDSKKVKYKPRLNGAPGSSKQVRRFPLG